VRPKRHTSEHWAAISLPNGTNLIEPIDNGLGVLTISNHSKEDAVVKLKTATSPATTVRLVYIRAMSDVTISGILPGEYLLQYSKGNDWDVARRVFLENQTFGQFENTLSFSEDRVENGIYYSQHTVTLHTVAHGNVHVKDITAAECADGAGQE
jgi:pterin-4a-carbinolamine dehydratase